MIVTEQELRQKAQRLGQSLKDREMQLAAAESCTGGWLAKIVTDLPGSSSWFIASVVSYSNEAKQSLLGVKQATLDEFGAVSQETVMEMSAGLFQHTTANIVVSISGIAGPDGGTDDKPVGLVWLGWGMRGEAVTSSAFHFKGDRDDVRRQSVEMAIDKLLEIVAQ